MLEALPTFGGTCGLAAVVRFLEDPEQPVTSAYGY